MRRSVYLSCLVFLFFLVLLSFVGTVYSDEKPKVPFSQFTTLEVENFDNPRFETKEAMPSEWVPLIREDIVQRVIEKHRFHHVADFHDEKVANPSAEKTLILRGKIIEYSQGSQAGRMIIGFGAGRGKIAAMCQFIDKDTGDIVWERKVDGKVIGAMQSNEGAIKGLSKEVAKVIDQRW